MAFYLTQDGDTLKVQYYCYTLDQIGVNTVYYRAQVNPEPGLSLNTVANLLATRTAPQYKAIISANAQFYGVQVYAVNVKPLPLAGRDNTNAGPGTSVGTALPRQVAGLVSLRTSIAGAMGRGRLYLPFPPVSANDVDNLPTDAYLAAAQTLATSLAGAPIPLGGAMLLTPVIYNRFIPATPTKPARPQGIINIESAKSVDAWATQRRRGSEGKLNATPPW